MKVFIEWGPELKIGNSVIDGQHQKLFELTNLMWNSREEPIADKLQLFEMILEELEAHCLDEERILAEIGYPSLQEHQIQHRELINQFKEVLNSCTNDSRETWYNMMSYLAQNLLLKHLMDTDLKYEGFLRDSGK
jgi:hemerythrin